MHVAENHSVNKEIRQYEETDYCEGNSALI